MHKGEDDQDKNRPKVEPDAQDLSTEIDEITFKYIENATRIQDYRGEPMWSDVPREKLSVEPYCRIVEVGFPVDGELFVAGSGWHWKSGVVLTAAHVVFNKRDVQIRFPKSQTWLPAPSVQVADCYRLSDTQGQPGSSFDWALLSIPSIDSESFGEHFSLPDPPDLFRAIGFLHGRMVEHAAIGQTGSVFIGHNANTEWGESGCPLFNKSQFRGIHLGKFGESRRYMGPPEDTFQGFLNVGIRLFNI